MLNVKALATAILLTWISVPSTIDALSQPTQPLTCLRDCRTDSAGFELIKHFEGYYPFVYKDVAGVPTIGFGHALRKGESIKQPLMGQDAQRLLESDLRAKERAINRLVYVRLFYSQFDALASFTYNLGEGTLAKSTLLKKVNSRRDAEVPAQFMRWTRAGGVELRGLVLRRQAEVNIYIGARR